MWLRDATEGQGKPPKRLDLEVILPKANSPLQTGQYELSLSAQILSVVIEEGIVGNHVRMIKAKEDLRRASPLTRERELRQITPPIEGRHLAAQRRQKITTIASTSLDGRLSFLTRKKLSTERLDDASIVAKRGI